jgi:dCTP diphosphatase
MNSSSGQTWAVSEHKTLAELAEQMREFTGARDWHRFHDPKSLMLALMGEVGELSELLQWLSAEQAEELAKSDPLNQRLGEEMSDVLLYLVRLADVCNVNLDKAVQSKLRSNEERFPVADFHGDAPIKN